MRFKDMRAFAPMQAVASRKAVRGKGDSWKRRTRCYWCNIRVSFTGGLDDSRATREHLVPRSQGGGGGQNITVACARCNHARGCNKGWIPFDAQEQWINHIEPGLYRRMGMPLRWRDGQVVLARPLEVPA